MKLTAISLCTIALFALSACGPRIYSQAEIDEICAQKRLESKGIYGTVGLGVNSRTGPRAGAQININNNIFKDDIDPDAVYEQCQQKYADINARAQAAAAAKAAQNG